MEFLDHVFYHMCLELTSTPPVEIVRHPVLGLFKIRSYSCMYMLEVGRACATFSAIVNVHMAAHAFTDQRALKRIM
jgi:hypothetical protein